MKPQDWYLAQLLRLDRIQAIVNALSDFYQSRSEKDALAKLAKLQRIINRP
jgi:hypothetical protein